MAPKTDIENVDSGDEHVVKTRAQDGFSLKSKKSNLSSDTYSKFLRDEYHSPDTPVKKAVSRVQSRKLTSARRLF